MLFNGMRTIPTDVRNGGDFAQNASNASRVYCTDIIDGEHFTDSCDVCKVDVIVPNGKPARVHNARLTSSCECAVYQQADNGNAHRYNLAAISRTADPILLVLPQLGMY